MEQTSTQRNKDQVRQERMEEGKNALTEKIPVNRGTTDEQMRIASHNKGHTQVAHLLKRKNNTSGKKISTSRRQMRQIQQWRNNS